MAKILLGIALAVMLATAALGYLAHTNAEKLQEVLRVTKQDLSTTKTTLAKTKEDLKTRTEELAAAKVTIEDKEKEIASTKGLLDDANKKVAEGAAAMEAKVAELAGLQTKYDELAKRNNPGGGTPVAGVEDPLIAALKADVAKAQNELAESKALIDSLTKQKKQLDDEMVSLKNYKKRVENSIAIKTLSGRILAVNTGWNFVVISIGDKQGAVMNATFLVVRDGTPIGKVRITSVEPSSSIADIIPGSTTKGMTIQPGDSVIVEGRTKATDETKIRETVLPH
ncbi:MAG: hypothetical protein K8R23_11415 [Chthoniobacter sp.]|nr:hypothetical protein [Chthoniobacter sp.]